MKKAARLAAPAKFSEIQRNSVALDGAACLWRYSAMKYAIVSLLLLLVACAPALRGANERGGMVRHISGLTSETAFKLADDHCRKHNRVARITRFDEWQNVMTFDCLDR